jgi:hypothetical protein
MVKLELSIEEVNIILAALGKLPLEVGISVWAKVKKDAEEQLTKKE